MTKDNDKRLHELDRLVEANTLALRKEFASEIDMASERPEFAEWEQQRKIFSVMFEDRRLYPAFQFSDDGRPLPVIGILLSIFRQEPERSDWQNAFWFFGGTGWLDGSAPMDLLRHDPQAVCLAANQDIAINTD